MKNVNRKIQKNYPTSIKWVRRAKMWSKTTWTDGVQKVEFSHEKPRIEQPKLSDEPTNR